MTSPGLLNAVSSTEPITTYTRAYGGAFNNPYGSAPSLTFFMHRVTVRDKDDSLLADSPVPNVEEPYTPKKTYQLFDPQTGEPIKGQTVTAEQVYAIIYSVMRQRIAEVTDESAAAAAAEEAAAAASAAETPPSDG